MNCDGNEGSIFKLGLYVLQTFSGIFPEIR